MRRIRRQRTNGWRMPEGAIYVGRPSTWGNPYLAGENRVGFVVRSACRRLGRPIPWTTMTSGGQRHSGQGVAPIRLSRDEAIACYRADLEAIVAADPTYLAQLRGRDLACWCPLDQPCHADVLLELANP